MIQSKERIILMDMNSPHSTSGLINPSREEPGTIAIIAPSHTNLVGYYGSEESWSPVKLVLDIETLKLTVSSQAIAWSKFVMDCRGIGIPIPSHRSWLNAATQYAVTEYYRLEDMGDHPLITR
jgi:hypothetical protein